MAMSSGYTEPMIGTGHSMPRGTTPAALFEKMEN